MNLLKLIISQLCGAYTRKRMRS